MQPDAEAQNAYLEKHLWANYRALQLGLTDCANDETKARRALGYRFRTRSSAAAKASGRVGCRCFCQRVRRICECGPIRITRR